RGAGLERDAAPRREGAGGPGADDEEVVVHGRPPVGSGCLPVLQCFPGRVLNGPPGRRLPGRAEDDGVSTSGRRERGTPALVPEACELEGEPLTRHSGRDEAHAGPLVEPAPAVGGGGPRARGVGEAGGGQGRDEE